MRRPHLQSMLGQFVIVIDMLSVPVARATSSYSATHDQICFKVNPINEEGGRAKNKVTDDTPTDLQARSMAIPPNITNVG